MKIEIPGSGILAIDGVPLCDVKTIDSSEAFDDDDYINTFDSPTFTLSKPSSFECELTSTLNVPIFKELSLMGGGPEPFYMEYDAVRYEQVRKHKKKRINKKWAKRYGYRAVPCRYRMENCYISHNTFNDFEIVSDPPKFRISSLYGSFGGK